MGFIPRAEGINLNIDKCGQMFSPASSTNRYQIDYTAEADVGDNQVK